MTDESNIVELRKKPTKLDELAEYVDMTPTKLRKLITQLESLTTVIVDNAAGNEESALVGAILSMLLTARKMNYSRIDLDETINLTWAVVEERESNG